MNKILLSAFACDPTKGSELGNGWNWAIGIASNNYEVHCLTRTRAKKEIEFENKPNNLKFHFIQLPFGFEKLYAWGSVGMYVYYLIWQWFAYRKGLALKRDLSFNVVHHVTWGSLQMGSFLYKMNLPFIFGPAGGGQRAPEAFKSYFKNHWKAELRRDKISDLFVKFNPAFKSMIKRAQIVLVSNVDTYNLAKTNGAKNVCMNLDSALADNFFPEEFILKKTEIGKLNLLWVGRMMPRKGLALVMEVMNQLKEYNGITLTVVGDGEMKNEFLASILKFDLQDKVKWEGSVSFEKVKDFYASKDVFFFTSLRDSGPSQLIEAMGFGMPVVTLNLHGQGQIVNDNTGIRCPCETPEIAIIALKNAILKLANNPHLVSLMSKNAFDFARQHSWHNKIKNIINQNYPS